MTSPFPVVYGKYELLELLARGGMAEVFKARAHGVEGFEKILVVKRILPHLSSDARFVELFINEAKIAVTLSHANVVQVFDLGRVDDSYFIAMEYVAGFDLATILNRARQHRMPVPPELAVFIASEVAKALDYAHRRRDGRMRPLQIVHRDVSPQNILVSYEGEVKLTDFGVARARDMVDDASDASSPQGKILYMAPEQARLETVDAQSDLYSLGVVLYEILSGVNPFHSDNAMEVVSRVQAGQFRPLHEVNTAIPKELSDMVTRAMSASREQRVPTASKFYEELIQFLYASGRRLGAYDLSRYLDELREAVDDQGAPTGRDQLHRAFAGGVEAVQHTGAGVTSIEAPARGSALSASPAGSAPGTRDVAAHLMVARFAASEEIPESTIRSLLRRFGGTLLRRSATAQERMYVAVFGTADSAATDAEGAVRCALRISRMSTTDEGRVIAPSVRVAVHSGFLSVNADGVVLDNERLESELGRVEMLLGRARPGDVITAGRSEKSLRNLFHVEPLEGEGTSHFRIRGERNIAAAHGRFVGRKDELRRIGEILALANRGKRRVLSLMGEPGDGKSRLLHETIRRLRLGNHAVGMYLVTIARSSREVPLSTVREMLRVIIGIDEFDPEPIIRQKIQRLRELGLSSAEIRSVEVNLGLRPKEDDKKSLKPLRSAIAHIAKKLAEDCLTVIAIDGADYMDDESTTLINFLIEEAKRSRLVLVLAHGPGYQHHWRGIKRYYEIEVPPLNADDVGELVQVRLRATEVPENLTNDVLVRTRGNALHVEEMVRALLASGAVTVEGGRAKYDRRQAEQGVPQTLREILERRIAALEGEQRRVLEVASVVGNRFTAPVVAQVIQQDAAEVVRQLALLEQLGFLVRRGSSEHAFANEAINDTVVGTLGRDEQRQLHGEVAAALEQLYPQRIDEMAERLAEHYRAAGATHKAIDHWVRSADRLESEGALDSAIGSLSRAIELHAEGPVKDRERLLALYWRIGNLTIHSRQLAAGVAYMTAGIDAADGVGRDDYVARFAMIRGRLLVMQNRFGEGSQWFAKARQMAKTIGNRELLRDITIATAEANIRNGRYTETVELLDEALALSRDTGDVQAQVRCLLTLSATHAAKGEHAAALRSLDEAQRIVGMYPERASELELDRNESAIHYLARNYAAALDPAERALERAKEFGLFAEAASSAHQVGMCQLYLGQYKQAFAAFRYSYELSREHGFTKTEMANLRALGFIDATRFQSEEGRARIATALTYAEERGFDGDRLEAKFLLALADYRLGHTEAAKLGLADVLTLATDQGNLRFRDDAARALLALERGEPLGLGGTQG